MRSNQKEEEEEVVLMIVPSLLQNKNYQLSSAKVIFKVIYAV